MEFGSHNDPSRTPVTPSQMPEIVGMHPGDRACPATEVLV
jgi:hypothetical protein